MSGHQSLFYYISCVVGLEAPRECGDPTNKKFEKNTNVRIFYREVVTAANNVYVSTCLIQHCTNKSVFETKTRI